MREHPDRREHEHRGQSRAAEPGPSRPRPEAPEAPESAGRRNDNDGKDSPGSSGYSYYTSDEEDKDEKPQQPKVPAAKPKVAAAKIDPPPTAQKKKDSSASSGQTYTSSGEADTRMTAMADWFQAQAHFIRNMTSVAKGKQ